MTDIPRSGRKVLVVLLFSLGAAFAFGGAITAFIAKASIGDVASTSSSIPTLPVNVYAQYTSRLVVPDYTGVTIGIVLATVGVILVTGTAIAWATRRWA